MIRRDCTALASARQDALPGRTRRRVLTILLVCLAWATVGFGPPILTSGGTPPAWRLDPAQVQALVAAVRMPAITAKAALLADASTGHVLLASHADDPLPPASTTKIMTALLVLERADPDALVTVPAEALIGEASMGLTPGERLTVRDLLYGLLLASGNDAAVTLASHVAGSPDAFVALMNQRAAELGLRASHFANPHGLDAPNHVMSAADLLTVTRAALAYDLFAAIVATPQTRVAGHLLVNRNELLTTYPGADGVKTGTTDAAGECLVASASRSGLRAIAVILGSRDRYADSRALLDHYFQHYTRFDPALPRSALSRRRWLDGRVRELVAETTPATTPTVVLPRWQQPLARPVLHLEGDGAPGTPAGKLTFYVGPRAVAEAPLRWQEP